MSAVDDYLKNVKPDFRKELQKIRNLVKSTVPEAEEVITYAMPGFKYGGKYLITYCAFTNHMSIFPGSEAIEDLQEKLKKFKFSKGTIQFTLENTIPESTLKAIVKHGVKRIDSNKS